MDIKLKTNKCSNCSECTSCMTDKQKTKFKEQNMKVPNMMQIFDAELQEFLKMYDKIFINHISNHYYDGQITNDTLQKIKEKLKENKKNIYN